MDRTLSYPAQLRPDSCGFSILVKVSSSNLTTEKTPYHMVLKWTEHCLTQLSSDPTLVDFQYWLKFQAQIYNKMSREPTFLKPQSLSTRTTCKPSKTKAKQKPLSVNQQGISRNNIGTLRLSKNNSQLHKTFRIKLLTKNDFVRSPSKNTALPHALSISCCHQVIDTTLSAETISVQTA